MASGDRESNRYRLKFWLRNPVIVSRLVVAIDSHRALLPWYSIKVLAITDRGVRGGEGKIKNYRMRATEWERAREKRGEKFDWYMSDVRNEFILMELDELPSTTPLVTSKRVVYAKGRGSSSPQKRHLSKKWEKKLVWRTKTTVSGPWIFSTTKVTPVVVIAGHNGSLCKLCHGAICELEIYVPESWPRNENFLLLAMVLESER